MKYFKIVFLNHSTNQTIHIVQIIKSRYQEQVILGFLFYFFKKKIEDRKKENREGNQNFCFILYVG